MNSAPIPEAWRQEYLKRPMAKLPGDLVKACDELRAQRREINTLRAQVLKSKIKNALLMAMVGGLAAKGIEVAVVGLIKAFAR
jgi:hypothetical protein